MNFQSFNETWVEQLRQLAEQLRTAARPPVTEEDKHDLIQLVDKVLNHYTEYYRVKSQVARDDVLSLFSAPWSTPLERSLHWIAGFRPTTVFHLVYTQSSIVFQSRIADILRGSHTGDLADLSPAQLRRVSELQCHTVHQENAITDQLSDWQDGAGDLFGMFELREDKKIEGLREIVEKADELRLKTVRRVVEFLTPQQAVEFLIAAAELQFGIRGWGLSEEERHRGIV